MSSVSDERTRISSGKGEERDQAICGLFSQAPRPSFSVSSSQKQLIKSLCADVDTLGYRL